MLRRLANGLAALVGVAAISVAVTPAAGAGTVQDEWSCSPGAGGWLEVYSVTVNVAATARQGDTVTLTGTVTGTRAQPGPRPAGYFSNGSLGLRLGGASGGWVTITGMTSPAANDRDPYALAGGSGQVTLNSVGTVTFTAGNAGFPLTGYPGFGLGCSDYNGVAPAAASIQVLPR